MANDTNETMTEVRLNSNISSSYSTDFGGSDEFDLQSYVSYMTKKYSSVLKQYYNFFSNKNTISNSNIFQEAQNSTTDLTYEMPENNNFISQMQLEYVCMCFLMYLYAFVMY